MTAPYDPLHPVVTTFVVAFAPDSDKILSKVESDGHLFDLNSGEINQTFVWPEVGSSTKISFFPDGRRMLVGLTDHSEIWDINTGERLQTLDERFATLVNQKGVIIGYSDSLKGFVSRNIQSVETERTYNLSTDYVFNGAAFSSGGDEERIAVLPLLPMEGKNTVIIMNLSSGTILHEIQVDQVVHDVVYSPTGNHILIKAETTAYLYDVSNLTSEVKQTDIYEN